MRGRSLTLLLQKVPLRRIVKHVVPNSIRLRLWRSAGAVAKWKLMDPAKMDEHLLDMLITNQGSKLDCATKEMWNVNKAASYCTQHKSLLEQALETCRVKKRTGDHIAWAERVMARYQRWEQERKRIIEPVSLKATGQKDDIYDVIRGRRSIRYFRAGDIEMEKIEQILEAGRWAPCASNRQSWRFIVQRVGKGAGGVKSERATGNLESRLLPHGAVVLYIAIDERLYPWKYAPAMDAAAAIQNMLLMAHHLGIGSCWHYCAEQFNQARLRAKLGLPDYCYIYSFIQLGYPAEAPEAPGRRPLNEITTFIGFDAKEKESN